MNWRFVLFGETFAKVRKKIQIGKKKSRKKTGKIFGGLREKVYFCRLYIRNIKY